MKKIIALLTVATLTTGLVACTGNNQPKPNQQPENKQSEDTTKKEPVNISFRIGWDEKSGRGEALNKITQRFNDSQDEIQVTMIGGNEDEQQILTLLNSGNAPEVMQMPYRYVLSLGEEGYWEELNDAFADDVSNFYDAIVNLATVNDKLYGMPWLGHSMALVYNKNLLAQAGVNPEEIKSFDDLTGALQAIEDNTDAKGIALVGQQGHDVTWNVTQFIYSFGGALVTEDKQQVAINTPEAKAGIDYYMNTLGTYAQQGWEQHSGGDAMGVFRNQQVAFEIQGPWGITDIWKNGNPFEVGAIPMSQLGAYAEVGPQMLAIPSGLGEEKQDAAVEFIEYMIGKDAQEQIMEGEYSEEDGKYYPFRVPARKDMADTVFFTEHPEFLAFIEGFKKPSINSPVPGWGEIKTKYYEPGLNAIATGERTIDEVVNEIETEGNKILQQ